MKKDINGGFPPLKIKNNFTKKKINIIHNANINDILNINKETTYSKSKFLPQNALHFDETIILPIIKQETLDIIDNL